MKSLKAFGGLNLEELEEAALDITGAVVVQILVRKDKKVIWINVNGVCVLRVCQIKKLEQEKL